MTEFVGLVGGVRSLSVSDWRICACSFLCYALAYFGFRRATRGYGGARPCDGWIPSLVCSSVVTALSLPTLAEVQLAMTQAVQEAAAQGDRSENAEYIYGKKQLREIDRRVRFLSKRLDDMTVVERLPEDQSRVFFGAWVELENEHGDLETYRLVGPDETDAERSYISIDAPLARALLKKQVDDEVEVRTPAGERCLFINRIWYVKA